MLLLFALIFMLVREVWHGGETVCSQFFWFFTSHAVKPLALAMGI